MRARAMIGAAALLLGACNPLAQVEGGDKQVEAFHAAYSRGDGGALYAMTGPRFRENTARAQFLDLVEAISVRLGPVTSSERTGFHINTDGNGTTTTITMTTTFAKGEGVETFMFGGSGDAMKLEGWNVQSPRLALTGADVAGERGDPPPPVVLVASPPADSGEVAPAVKKKVAQD